MRAHLHTLRGLCMRSFSPNQLGKRGENVVKLDQKKEKSCTQLCSTLFGICARSLNQSVRSFCVACERPSYQIIWAGVGELGFSFVEFYLNYCILGR